MWSPDFLLIILFILILNLNFCLIYLNIMNNIHFIMLETIKNNNKLKTNNYKIYNV